MTQIIPLKDVLLVPGLTISAVVETMATDDFEFHGKGEYITLCGDRLRFPVVDDLLSLKGFPITKRIFKTTPYICDALRHDIENAGNPVIGIDVANK